MSGSVWGTLKKFFATRGSVPHPYIYSLSLPSNAYVPHNMPNILTFVGVAKACNSCNVRRARCSGGHPCERCQRSSRECQYSVAEPIVTITQKEYDNLRRCQRSEQLRNSPAVIETHPNGHDEQQLASEFGEELSESTSRRLSR